MSTKFIPVPLPIQEEPLDVVTLDANAIADDWLSQFCGSLKTNSQAEPAAISSVFVTNCDPFWKDHLALTWAQRTARSAANIDELFGKAVKLREPQGFQLISATGMAMSPRLGWIQAMFTFITNVAKCSGVVKLVPEDGAWKAWTVLTKMDDIIGYERDLARLDLPDQVPDTLAEVDVLILGAGQAGLQVAANLRALGLSTVVVEQGARVGDHWRGRYEALRLHLSKYYSQLAYRPWPENFPYYPSLHDIADGLEDYSRTTHLNILTSSRAVQAAYCEAAQKWSVDIMSHDGTLRTVEAGQLVFATGVNGAIPSVPYIPGKDGYKGTALHSSVYRDASEWKGKRAVVIGTASSGHDIAQDLCNAGADVTMIQRSPSMVVAIEDVQALYGRIFKADGPPLEIADLMWESTPIPINRTFSKMNLGSDAVRAKHEGLRKAGFMVAETDPMDAVYNRGGGHYLDVGASALIIDGKIKMKAGIPITAFIPAGLAFEDGTSLDADLVVFATGYNLQSMSQTARQIVGEDIGHKLKDVWGLDTESHLRGMHRNSGHPRLWYAGGDLGMSRYYAKLLALQVLATEKGLLTSRLED
ncbi:FAD/NAD(P)-binding domain-containing protein [Calocera cornea HHB12733]|uniref:FAD/NAD(P)-binding domain-containing protein n=1 Tax=Calocera cornea HHB12733 TaxID=1353952 RepID=A0A165JDU2_9BASI|nr:FAD/NAD(P)-binding domain-containing protein [Calocera cornea HHB12733]